MEGILGTFATLRDARGWVLVQSRYAVDNSNKSLLDNLLNVIQLVNDFTLELYRKPKAKEFTVEPVNELSLCASMVSSEVNIYLTIYC